jgi:hypothetical protein
VVVQRSTVQFHAVTYPSRRKSSGLVFDVLASHSMRARRTVSRCSLSPDCPLAWRGFSHHCDLILRKQVQLARYGGWYTKGLSVRLHRARALSVGVRVRVRR